MTLNAVIDLPSDVILFIGGRNRKVEVSNEPSWADVTVAHES